MKKSLLILSTIALTSCITKHNIIGKIDGLTNDSIIVQSFLIADIAKTNSNPSQYVRQDTLVVRDSRLILDRNIEQPTLFTVRPMQTIQSIHGGHRWFSGVSDIHFFLSKGERVKIHASVDSIYTDYSLSGSTLNRAWSRYRAEQRQLQIENTRLILRLDNTRMEVADSILQNSRLLQRKITEAATKYIRENPNALLSGYLLAAVPTDSITRYYDNLGDKVRSSLFKPMIDYILQRAEMNQIRQQAREQIKPGALAPDFTLKTPDGTNFTLSSLRGKYVVLDFWGSWCGWCIQGFPKMRENYTKYNGKFEIVGIACNDTRDKWIKAIEKHQLPWIHVFNPQDTPPTENIAARYNIQGFPTKIILSPEGRIIAFFSGESPEFYQKLAAVLK